MTIAKSPVVTMAPTTPVNDAIQIMSKEGFRRIPIADPGTKRLRGIIVATDIVNYLGGGEKFQIIQRKYAGNFFKAINEPVRSLMTQKVLSVPVSAKISDAIRLMKKRNIGGLPVVDEENQVWAIITERDIALLFSRRLRGAKVADVMSKNVVTAKPEITVSETEKTMIEHGFRRLPIVSNHKVVALVTVMDILRFFGTGKVFKHLQSGTISQVLQTPILETATKNIATIEADADVTQAARIMQERNIGSLPVVEDEKLIGIITERDFFKLID
ncbi:MAG: CBS domain-containing protein [Candidatus Bathyarchaeota archaeon]|nr:MAG: CBS domain-containing protein [Candidatus Bathyarchaeota archaeon]